MLAAPLFHVHPEADHRHGEAEHVHDVIVHMVWSPDLESEFDGHQPVDPTEESALDGISSFVQPSHVGDRHAELGVSLLNDSVDRKSINTHVTQAFGLLPAVVLDVGGYPRIQPNTSSGLLSILVGHVVSPRGPPSLLL
jgi:hypothetical protein